VDISLDDINGWLEVYRSAGPLIAFILPFLEAFFPVLPLFAIITANAAAFGLWKGFIYTWFGACMGSLLTFYMVRRFGSKWSKRAIEKYEPLSRSSLWIEQHGFSVLFLLRCFPFSPSSLINVLAGLSSISLVTYFWATILGKSVSVFILSYIGSDFSELLEDPWKLTLTIMFVTVIWIIGKKVEKHFVLK
jgi:uncharacterized membrane protein YdjX (TVP38/TMEM64 family)